MKLGSKEADVAYDRWMGKLADEYWGANDLGDDEAEESDDFDEPFEPEPDYTRAEREYQDRFF